MLKMRPWSSFVVLSLAAIPVCLPVCSSRRLVEGVLDRFDPHGTRSSAAVEWRTIPPTIKVRNKKRPPPLTLQTRRSSESNALSPGPLDSSTTTSSFTSWATSVDSGPRSARSATLQPSSARSEYYAVPAFQNSPSAEHLPKNVFPEDFITGPTRHDPPPAPPNPYQYLVEHPWSIDEYLRLLAAVSAHTVDLSINWTHVADRYNSTIVREPRSVWDCWHRATVPWMADEVDGVDPSSMSTFKSTPGVQHDYRHIDMQSLITIHKAISIAQPKVVPPLVSNKLCDTAPRYARHPSYPSPASMPNVPPRSLGDGATRGILAWFSLTAVNMTMLRKVLDAGNGGEFSAGKHLPKHLQTLTLPPPRFPRSQRSSPPTATCDVKRGKANQMLEKIRVASTRREAAGDDVRQ
ncbi:hypothetical protein OF83DRAFT_1123432 [Amylostereum chailletii]|nr:hypothetical protein OF83DRAFT_1123432 [Amylostereum chailletii]